ncbi:MAG: SCP2 sterol-binding domain-containing protein [Spirochaetaceae bacterium]|nr:SCP2 sterol-binding domain-containing protein [Spirochaetaceae bacterium]
MGMTFGSVEWVAAYKDAINASAAYKSAAANWTHGVVALIVLANPPSFPQDAGIWLDLDRGVCREAKLVSVDEAKKAPFCISGDYARWKQVVRKELDPIKGMMQGKLRLKGDLPTIVRAVRASQELVNSSGSVDTVFSDETA